MIGIAVSLYDKFDDLGVLVDILRHNFEEEYYISVCSNHPDAASRIEPIDVDHFVQGAEIEYTPEMSGLRADINLNSRILDSMQRSCRGAMDAGCEYVMHLHADAWPLDESKLLGLVDRLDDSEKHAAVRGMGSSYRRPKFWLGSVMDQFFLFESDGFAERSFFEFDPRDLLPHTAIHNMLMLLLLGNVGRSNFFYYSDKTTDLWWDDREKTQPYAGVRPSTFVPEYGFVHVAAEDFPEDYGRSVQANYLRRFDITGGEYVTRLRENHEMQESKLFRRLRWKELKQNLRVRCYGYRPVTFGRRYPVKADFLDKPFEEKLTQLAKNVGEEIYHQGHRLLFAVVPFTDERFTGDHRSRNLYRDAAWPEESMGDLFRDTVEPADFPADFGPGWYEYGDE
ncbi:hypothetical protein [Haloarcula salinisoli]|uniref:Uncharacterized protein n=1 Tax=Haloarcula salinisoli TaxID=2487746 RepID=A0A8J7YKW2_9EURY|nr:hypothetical protein [Halomicroarcula salinisoli]MBX0303038.1 hypothetical protein [Halomicroarcula salinisoli]